MKLSIVIPAYNEEKRIKSTLSSIISYLNNKTYDSEIIVVDDGSFDNTIKVVEEFNNPIIKIHKNNTNRGKGYSVKQGVSLANGQYILFSDADLSTPIVELDQFMNYIESNQNTDIIIGSRNLPQSNIPVKQPFLRQKLGKIFPLVVKLLVVKNIKDTQCGFKLFTKDAANKIFPLQSIEGFAFDVEILFIAQKLGLKIKELPITWNNAEGSKVSLIKDSAKMFLSLLKIRWNHFNKKY